jgi:hypothetical protein
MKRIILGKRSTLARTSISRSMWLISVGWAFQGHPEAGAPWKRCITGIPEGLGLQPTARKRNLNHGEINRKVLLVCHQVDDFSVAAESWALA